MSDTNGGRKVRYQLKHSELADHGKLLRAIIGAGRRYGKSTNVVLGWLNSGQNVPGCMTCWDQVQDLLRQRDPGARYSGG